MTTKHIIILGAGRVGGAMARDLAKDGEFQVTVADLSETALGCLEGLGTRKADLSNAAGVAAAVEGADLVIGAVPGFMGFETVKAVLEAGKDIVDISFFEEDPFRLDELAKEKGCVAVTDCGVAPGCGNILLGHMATYLDRVDRFVTLVGGLPVVRSWPFEYQAGFSPIDVIEEYTRPSRYIAHGEEVVMPALSEPELIDFPGIGTLEAFNTDGLRTLLHTIDAPFKIEKTLRYPGHIEKMRMLREVGFFNKEPIDVGGVKVAPLDLTTKLLFPMWQMKEGDEDFTVLRVVVEGEKDGRRVMHTFDMLDRYDPISGVTSMARTTGYTCTAVARLVASGGYTQKGISPPEFVGRDPGCRDFVLAELQKRGIRFIETVD
jgi:saccharopine dehydrogenase-like NADP-dependent oxidoreductase